MQKIRKVFIATTAITCLLQAGSMQAYGVESGKVEYSIKGSGSVMGMGKIKIIGKKRLIFTNFGAKRLEEENRVTKQAIMGQNKVTKEHTLTILNGSIVYTVAFDKKKITRMKNPSTMILGNKSAKDYGEEMLKKMGGKKIGVDKVLGYKCDVWSFMGSKQCIYKGVPLRVETDVMGIKNVELATKAEFDISLSKDNFKLPDFPIYSININNGKQTKLKRAELEDMDKEDNQNIQAQHKEKQDFDKEMHKSLKKAGVKDAQHASKKEIENAMLPIMKKKFIAEAKDVQKARDCIKSASNLKEANRCVPKGEDKFDSWNNNIKKDTLKEINTFLDAIPCIKKAQSMGEIQACMPMM